MIRLLREPEDWFGRLSDPMLVRMAGVLSAYGCGYSFALFWQQTDTAGNTTAWISSLDGNLTLSALETADLPELGEFLRVVGGKSLTCSLELAHALELEIHSTASVLFRRGVREWGKVIPTVSDLKTVFSILQSGAGESMELPDASAFYADLSHRVRHHAARAVLVRDSSDTPVAAAVTSAEAGNAALLSGVATLPEVRGQGYGSAAVERMLESLSSENRDVFVLSRPEQLNFYRRLGFVETGTVAFCEV